MPDNRDDFQRKRTMRQKRIRRRRIKITIVVMLVLLIFAAAVLALTVLFPVKSVKATGSQMYTADQIVVASGLDKKDNMITFSGKKVTERLQAQLPYIENVKIIRNFPYSVEIKVTDAKEHVCYKVGAEYYTVSAIGRVLNSYNAQPQELPLINCPDVECALGYMIAYNDKKSGESTQKIIEGLYNDGIEINTVDVSNPLAITVKVEGRFIVNFGTSGSLDKKIAHLKEMLVSIKAKGDDVTGRINLSMWSPQKKEGTFVKGAIE